MSHRFSALVSVVLTLSVLSLTACAGPADTTETSPAPAASASATAGPVGAGPAEHELSEPSAVLGGACENVLTNDQVGSVLGLTVTETSKSKESAPYGGDTMAIRGAGGVYCYWEQEGNADTSLFFTVLSTAVLDGTAGQEVMDYTLASPTDCASIFEGWCDFSFVESGYWFHGTLSLRAPAAEAVATIDSLRGFAAEASAAAADAGAYTANLDITGAWAETTDCVALAQTVDVPAMLNEPTLEVVDWYTGPVEPFPGWSGARSAAGQSTCMWTGETSDPAQVSTFYIDFSPGGAWLEEEVAAMAGAEKISGEGVDRAYLVPKLAGQSPTLVAFDGVNRLAIQSPNLPVGAMELPLLTSILVAKNQLG